MDHYASGSPDSASLEKFAETDSHASAPAASPHAKSGCPVDVTALVSEWAGNSLLCRAGRREFSLNRYSIAAVRDGRDLRQALDVFLGLAASHKKTGLLAVAGGAVTRAQTVREELALLAELVCGAGLAKSPEEALSGKEICLPVGMPCPVTGRDAVYSFFPVTFCRHAANPADDLYDVSLSCPWTAINTTSDAFAFAMMVRDRCRKIHACEPFEIGGPERLRGLLDWAVMAWQNMSVATISAFSRLSERPERAVGLVPGGKYWTAAHQDPVFAELSKETYAHEMPVLYGRALAEKWFDALFAGETFNAGREGQTGGVKVGHDVRQGDELQQLSFC